MTSEPPAVALRASARLAVASRRRPERAERPEKTSLAVRNLQRRIPIDSGRLRAFLRAVAPAAGAPSGSATVALVTDGRMRALNRDFRGLDKSTDVLSFRSTLPRELEILALHGFLHLLGYDHETDDGEMRRIEYRLRRKLRVTRKKRALNNSARALREREPSARAKSERSASARSGRTPEGGGG